MQHNAVLDFVLGNELDTVLLDGQTWTPEKIYLGCRIAEVVAAGFDLIPFPILLWLSPSTLNCRPKDGPLVTLHDDLGVSASVCPSALPIGVL